MKVFLLKDIEKVGIAGEIIKTTEGYARNYLIPRKLAIEVTPHNEASLSNRIKVVEHRKEVVATKTSILAEKIKSTELVLKRKMHDGGKLYGSVSSGEIVDLLALKGIGINKSQVSFDKSIKSKGSYPVTIKLSSTLQPTLTLKVVPEEQNA
jgi:large subunit ribosomal protein L9